MRQWMLELVNVLMGETAWVIEESERRPKGGFVNEWLIAGIWEVE